MSKTKKIFFILSLLVIVGCGTGIGNGVFSGDPTSPDGSPPVNNPGRQPPRSYAFQIPLSEYNSTVADSCGKFTQKSSASQIEAGRQCLRDARANCTEAKYLYEKTNNDGTRFFSFVNISSTVDDGLAVTCQVNVHTVSDVPPNYLDAYASCDNFTEGVIPELSCDILYQ